jgi:DNA-directed RNA polymerase subunit N (RpoN/RPB10)
MLPVRCFTCNKVIGQFEIELALFKKKHEHLPEEQIPFVEFFEAYRITRYCCRKIFLTHVDIYQHDTETEMEHVEVRKHLEVQKVVISD